MVVSTFPLVVRSAHDGLPISDRVVGERWHEQMGWVARFAVGPDRRLATSNESCSSGDYFVFLGESLIDSRLDRPSVFAQVCCLVERVAYLREIVPALEDFKQRWFGRSDLGLHPGVRRDPTDSHRCFESTAVRRAFAADFYAFSMSLPFYLFAVAVWWTGRWRRGKRGELTEHLYDKTIPVWMTRLCERATLPDLAQSLTFVAESQNDGADSALWLRFRAARQVIAQWSGTPELRFAQSVQKETDAGLDIARMAALPIARHVRAIEPRIDPAFECLRPKFLSSRHDATDQRGIYKMQR